GARDVALVLDAEAEGPHRAEDAVDPLVVGGRRVEVEHLCGRGLTGLGAARPGGVGVAEELVGAAAGGPTGREGGDRPRIVQRRGAAGAEDSEEGGDSGESGGPQAHGDLSVYALRAASRVFSSSGTNRSSWMASRAGAAVLSSARPRSAVSNAL